VTWFLAIAAAMIAGALAWVLPPLLRRRARVEGIPRRQSNLAILRDQQAELEAELERGAITREHYERAKGELERRVLEEVDEVPARSAGAPDGRWVAGIVGAVIPLAAAVLYFQIGSPDAISLAGRSAGADHGGPAATAQQVEQMVERLAARLQAKPDDAEGWYLLGRSYYVMGKFSESAAAYERAVKLQVEEAGLYADYADAVAMSQDRRLDDKVLALVDRALKLDPEHPKALIMAGTAALQRKDYRSAVSYLERLERVAPPGSDLARMVGERLQEVRAEAGLKGDAKVAQAAPKADAKAAARAEAAEKSAEKPAPGAPAAGAVIKGRVTLSPSIAAKAAPTDTVFVLARALEGPRMPLAILKRQVKDLPLDFTLSDEQAMSPEMKLSKFREVIVIARVSKSGGAAPQSGDMQGQTSAVKVGATGVNITIESVVP
jgi:cytochrome c-type biogenesis protein CcmH